MLLEASTTFTSLFNLFFITFAVIVVGEPTNYTSDIHKYLAANLKLYIRI